MRPSFTDTPELPEAVSITISSIGNGILVRRNASGQPTRSDPLGQMQYPAFFADNLADVPEVVAHILEMK